MTQSEITITIDNPYPVYKSALSDEAGGTFDTGIWNFFVVAWYTSAETDLKSAGVERNPAALANWQITLTGDDKKINIDWTAPDRIPHHYAIYWQDGSAGIGLGGVIYKCQTSVGISVDKRSTSAVLLHPTISRGDATVEDLDGETLTDTVTGTFVADEVAVGDYILNDTDGSTAIINGVTSATVLVHPELSGGTDDNWEIGDDYTVRSQNTLGADAGEVTLDLLEKFTPRMRNLSAVGYNAKVIRKSHASSSIVEGLDMTVNSASCTRDVWNSILYVIGNSIDVALTDGDTGALIQTYYGRFTGTNYLGSWSKGNLKTYDLSFIIEKTEA